MQKFSNFEALSKMNKNQGVCSVIIKTEDITTGTLRDILYIQLGGYHPRRPRGSQSDWEKRCDESFQAWAKERLGKESEQTISKWSSECWLLIGHKESFVLLCAISISSSFCMFVHDSYCLAMLVWFVHQRNVSQETFSLI